MSRLPHEQPASALVKLGPTVAVPEEQAALRIGNREVISDHYFHLGVDSEPQRFQNKVFVRLGATRGTVFRKVSFKHCVFDGCYLANCSFGACPNFCVNGADFN